MKRSTTTVLFLSWTLAACGEAGADATDPAAGVRMDTVGGVPHVVNTDSGAWTAADRWRIDSAAAVVIGTLEGAEEYVFGQVSGVVVGADGRIHVADMQANEIRTYSPEGEFIGSMGREGDGPGEFRYLTGIGRAPGGGVAALDPSAARVTIFGPDGEYARSFRIERGYTIIMPGSPVPFDSAGRFYDRTNLAHSVGIDSIAVLRYAPDGLLEDTIMVSVDRPKQIEIRKDGVLRRSFPVPFAPQPSSAIGPAGRIYATDGATYSIVQMSPEGDTLRVIEREVAPVPVPEELREQRLAWVTERYEESGGDPDDLPPLPEHMPAITGMRVDEAGYLWVRRMGMDGSTREIFNPEGRYLGALPPPEMTVVHIGWNTIAGVTRDELGVQRVVVMPVVRGGGAAVE